MTSSNNKSKDAEAHGKPPVSGATWVEEYERATGHVGGYWRAPDGRRIDSVEVSGDDVQILVLSKKKNGASASFIPSALGIGASSITQPVNAENDDAIKNASVSERLNIAGDKATSAGTLSILAKDDDWRVRLSVSENKNAPPDALSILAKDDDWRVRLNVAKNNKNAPPDALSILANDDDWRIRLSVAENNNTPAYPLRLLAYDYSGVSVREAVAINTNTPVDTLRLLAKDDDWRVREAVAGNTNTPADALRTLAKDEDENVRDAAHQNL